MPSGNLCFLLVCIATTHVMTALAYRRSKNSVSTISKNHGSEYSPEDLSRIIEMAWEDRTPFEAIENLYGLNQHQLIELMRKELKRSSFELWRKRTTGRTTKHLKLRSPEINRGYCPTQYKR
jgi:uncharacterized protein (TIGR03643 family)